MQKEKDVVTNSVYFISLSPINPYPPFSCILIKRLKYIIFIIIMKIIPDVQRLNPGFSSPQISSDFSILPTPALSRQINYINKFANLLLNMYQCSVTNILMH